MLVISSYAVSKESVKLILLLRKVKVRECLATKGGGGARDGFIRVCPISTVYNSLTKAL